MLRNCKSCRFIVWLVLLLSIAQSAPTVAIAQESSADARARATEQQMTDDERFGLIHSLMVVVFTGAGGKRDPRVPKNVLQIAGWVKGVPRLGVPDLLLTDAGLGITNPQGGRKGDTYHEGAEVGYRWLAKTGGKPNYAFGHGLSYTSFSYSNLKLSGGETIAASFAVTNTGKRAGADVPQLYLTNAAGEKRMRLLGFERVQLKPGESRQVKLTADPRLLARFDGSAGQWCIAAGNY